MYILATTSFAKYSLIRHCPVCAAKVSLWAVVKPALTSVPKEIECLSCGNRISTIYSRKNHLVFVGFILTLALGKLIQKIFGVESFFGYFLLSVVVIAILAVGFYLGVKLSAPRETDVLPPTEN